MSLVGPVISDNKNAHTHADIMNDFYSASASAEAYRNPLYRPSHSRSRSSHSRTSQHSPVEDMSMPYHDSSMRLQPLDFSQPKPNNPYQDTQMAHPSFNPSANNLSPSISSYHEHTTPETLLSDPVYTDISQYTTPGFDDELLEAQVNMEFLSVGAMNTFNASFPDSSVASRNSSGPSSVNASNNNLLAPTFSASYGGATHLVSPSLTTHSSPGSSNECLANPSLVSAPALNGNAAPRSLTPGMDDHSHGMPIPQQQQSPALTPSPGGGYLDVPQDRSTNFPSPVVRIENFSRDESPARTDLDRSLGNKRSGNHLSPHDLVESDDDESGQSFVREVPIRTMQVPAPLRDEDGSWIRNSSSGQAGLHPDVRKDIQDQYVPTLKEQEDQRLMEERNHDVAEWLTKSEVGSEAGGPESRPRRKKQSAAGRRRARSTNDILSRSKEGLGVQFPPFNIPGPGLPLNVESEDEDLGASEEDDTSDGPDSPPAQVDIEHDGDQGSYFPQMPPTMEDENLPPHIRPWRDAPHRSEPSEMKYQPETSNAAMMKFHQRARDLETASLAVTVGSQRRRSESEIGSVRQAAGISKAITTTTEAGKPKEKTRSRKGSLLDNLKRHPSNILKRKGSHPSHPSQQGAAAPSPPALSLETSVNVPPERTSSWGRSKSPKPDSSPTALFKDHGSLAPFTYAKNRIRRSRSRSDIGSKTPGLSELMRTHGGPPTLSLVTPANTSDAQNPGFRGAEGSGDEDDGDFDEVGGVTMDLKVRSDPIIPTIEGFRSHARLLNPRVDEYMVERIAQEQHRRYKKLLDLKVKHLKAVKEKSCGSKGFCADLGGHPKILPPPVNKKDGEAPFAGFQIVVSSEDEIDASEEGTIIPKPLPPGFPIPPVRRMPAEFECPLCFKVKKFFKPSDWTKHVYEDLQPFTCTFPNCGEPMSFKRKADWVRHEDERHRQLKRWICERQGCGHVCYRKDNFVQHLVREHKVPEPKARVGRAANAPSSVQIDVGAWKTGGDVFGGAGDMSDKIWALVEACRQDTPKQPSQEPCRFCGNICPTWKKLTVHLAKHLEQISLPILPLVENKQLSADSVISPVERRRPRAASSAAENGKQESSANSSYSSYNQDGPPANVMHTYPPPQFQHYGPQAPAAVSFGGDVASSFTVRSYPLPATAHGMRLNPNQYGYPPSITPITDIAAAGQVFHSPVEAGPFGSELPTNLYAYNGPMGSDFATMAGQVQGEQVNGGQYQHLPSSYPRQRQGYPDYEY
ncbi:hypothetical protein DIS24_g5282 [Lasiodiplodia hormozganensis]|uniref:C2H2-type domain-containing protein n=1 Tax=Lasiodiplodia hormozganensis TaxID=869390 RepID=A0AA39YL62_9PEZI|nr:hypothetical protein DIS24_g5282 [Lasiodiplodia hormozganensis]